MLSSRWHIYWRGKNSRAIRCQYNGYEGRIPSLKRLLIHEVIFSVSICCKFGVGHEQILLSYGIIAMAHILVREEFPSY